MQDLDSGPSRGDEDRPSRNRASKEREQIGDASCSNCRKNPGEKWVSRLRSVTAIARRRRKRRFRLKRRRRVARRANRSRRSYGDRQLRNLTVSEPPMQNGRISAPCISESDAKLGRTLGTDDPEFSAAKNRKDRRRSRHTRLRLGTWNVRTLRSRERLREISLALEDLKIDVCGLSEVRRPSIGSAIDAKYAYWWSGNPFGKQDWIGGVGVAVHLEFLKKCDLDPASCCVIYSTPRVMVMKFPRTDKIPDVMLMSCYAPTSSATNEELAAFYESMSEAIAHHRRFEVLWCIGDFNGRVGDSIEDWPGVLGPYGARGVNKGGRALLEFSTKWNLRINNTFFKLPAYLLYSWKDLRRKVWSCLDFILTKQNDACFVKSVTSKRKALTWSDHCIIVADFLLKTGGPKRRRNKEQARKQRVDVSRCKSYIPKKKLQQLSSQAILAKQHEGISAVESALYQASCASLGLAKKKNADWFVKYEALLLPLIRIKIDSYNQWRLSPTNEARNRMISSRRIVKESVRGCKNSYWQEKAHRMQQYATNNDLALLYHEIKQIGGVKGINSIPPIWDPRSCSLLSDPMAILEQKVHYATELFTSRNAINEQALQELDPHPVATHLDDAPSFDEVKLAINSLKNNKSAGMDGVPSEVWKYGGEDVVNWLHSEFERAWVGGTIPSSWKDAEILLLWKGKGGKSDLDNYRSIALLASAGKVLAKVIQARIGVYAESEILSSSFQWGFRPAKSTIDPLSIVRRLEEHAIEKRKELHFAFLDISKAYDSVDRPTMWQILEKFGFPNKLIDVVKGLHIGQQGRIVQNGQLSRPFGIKSGLRQGCVLAPTMFLLYMEAIARRMEKKLSSNVGLKVNFRLDGNLFDVQRLNSRTRCQTIEITHLLYADDALLVSSSRNGLQRIVSAFEEAATDYGLKLSIEKTKTMTQGGRSVPKPIEIYGKHVEQVQQFRYLGAIIAASGTSRKEIDSRVSKMQSAFGRLWKPVYGQKSLSIKTKLMVYSATVLSVMRYGLSATSVYRRDEKRLAFVHFKHLRSLLGYTWRDGKSYLKLLEESGQEPISQVLTIARLKYLQTLASRPTNNNLPLEIMCGELAQGKRKLGGQNLKLRRLLKKDMLHLWDNVFSTLQDWKILPFSQLSC